MSTPNEEMSIQIQDVEKWDAPEGQPGQGMKLVTSRGEIEAIIHHDEETTRAIVWVWGASVH